MEAVWNDLIAEVEYCRKCPRLVEWREQVARERKKAFLDQVYWGRPVPGFGDPSARVLAVGLAPGAHGSNRTGRMFTGDSSGVFLYRALHRVGFASQPGSTARGDGLTLQDILISAVCRCVPPANKPTQGEIDACLPYLAREAALLENLQVVVALGRIAYEGILDLFSLGSAARTAAAFKHGAVYNLDAFPPGDAPLPRLVCSYHPSRQNTQTGRLTPEMFDQVWETVQGLLV